MAARHSRVLRCENAEVGTVIIIVTRRMNLILSSGQSLANLFGLQPMLDKSAIGLGTGSMRRNINSPPRLPQELLFSGGKIRKCLKKSGSPGLNPTRARNAHQRPVLGEWWPIVPASVPSAIIFGTGWPPRRFPSHRWKPRRPFMDTTTLLIIIVIVLIVFGGGWYGRGRWF